MVTSGQGGQRQAPAYLLSVDGRDITPGVNGRLISLTLTESRGDEADQLDITLDDTDGRMAIPSRGAEVTLQLGWDGHALVDKGVFVVDEVEHGGAPDELRISARSASMRATLRQRAEKSWHETTLGQVVRDIAARHGLTPRIDEALAAITVPHLDQTGESDLHLLTRLARQHDAVATVKKERLVVLPINSATTAGGAALPSMAITRKDGDQHRWHSADRNAYSGVRATWHDHRTAQKHDVMDGEEGNEKRLKDTFASEQDALSAARAERGRIQRGECTFELTLALGRPDVMPQARVRVSGFKPQIDSANWLVKKATHNLDGSGGYTTRLEMELVGL